MRKLSKHCHFQLKEKVMVKQVNEQLESLHRTLKESPELDSETHDLLLKIADDIAKLEGNEAGSPELSDAVQEQVIRFEHEHPAISAILRQLTDTLGRIGV